MKCPECNGWAKVMDSRQRSDGSRIRRYECRNEHRFTSVERIESPRAGRGPKVDIEVASRMIREGHKLKSIGADFGVTGSAVHQALTRAGLPTSAKAYGKKMKCSPITKGESTNA